MTPRWPIFIPSKGRADTRLTMRAFDAIGVEYTVFVEAQEFDAYAQHIDASRLHVLPHRDKGLTVTRNYIWDYAARLGVEWFWTFDDNIRCFYRYNRNFKVPLADGTFLAVMEEFVSRYTNVAIAGMNYSFFIVRKRKRQGPYILNTRIYSNMLLRTNTTLRDGSLLRNVTFFNDDTDLCLRALKDGWCTVLFQAFLIFKSQTMTIKGGMTDYYEKTDQRREFAEELQRAHPDMVRVGERWGRWHHFVDFSVFKQPLRRRADVLIPHGVNNFGMVLQERVGETWVERDEPTLTPATLELQEPEYDDDDEQQQQHEIDDVLAPASAPAHVHAYEHEQEHSDGDRDVAQQLELFRL